MCGIAGIVRYPAINPRDKEKLARMVESQTHRGPDGHGIFVSENCVLGQTRLAVISPKKHPLPLQRYDMAITFNGEIYNYKALKRELEGEFHFVTDTDTEVVLAAYRKWGDQCVAHFDGMFAFFVWNEPAKTGFAARDRMGVKPFFYTTNRSDGLAFAYSSQAASLAVAGVIPFQVSDHYLAEYLTAPYFSGALNSPFASVSTLSPGDTLRISDKGVETQTYFRYSWSPTTNIDSIELETALKQALEAQCEASASVGVFLSGGLDSTLIAALAPHKLEAWTIHYRDNTADDFENSLIVKSDDVPMAVLAAKELGLNLNKISVSNFDYEDHLTRTLAANDLICAWEQEVSQNILAQNAAEKHKAVLVGDAADETHFGYSFLLRTDIASSPQQILNFFGMVPLSKSFMKNADQEFNHHYRAYAENLGHSWNTEAEQKFATSRLIADLWLRRLLHNGDTHTMAHGLEARVPFTDKNLLRLAQKLKPSLTIEKPHLRNIASRYVSKELANRPKSALTKNLGAKNIIHGQFIKLFKNYGELLAPYADMDQLSGWLNRDAHSLTDREVGLEFRVLALLSWWRRFL